MMIEDKKLFLVLWIKNKEIAIHSIEEVLIEGNEPVSNKRDWREGKWIDNCLTFLKAYEPNRIYSKDGNSSRCNSCVNKKEFVVDTSTWR